MEMKPRTAIVTGAAQGIGFGVAERLALLGHRVHLIDIDARALARSIDELTDRGLAVCGSECDIADWDRVAASVAKIEDQHGPVEILINNAGGSISHNGRAHAIDDMPIGEWQRVVAVNLTGAFHMCRACLPAMKRGGWGRIVNFSSQGGRMRSLLSGAAYAASKAGLIGFTRVLAGETGHFGITANCIAPGRIATAQSDSFDDATSFIASVPAGRIGEVTDIAAGVAYLVSEEASFVTGTVLDINGGFFMP